MQPGERVILVDDLIATGGTAEGAVKLLRQIGANVVAAFFIVDLPDIGERLCTYLPWFGESKLIFVYEYLRGLLRDSGFISVTPALECGQSLYAPREWEAGSLDDRCRMSLIVEALK